MRLDRGWDYTRHIIAAQLGSMGTKTVKPTDVYRCIFDEAIEEMKLTPEEWEYIKKAWNVTTKYEA